MWAWDTSTKRLIVWLSYLPKYEEQYIITNPKDIIYYRDDDDDDDDDNENENWYQFKDHDNNHNTSWLIEMEHSGRTILFKSKTNWYRTSGKKNII